MQVVERAEPLAEDLLKTFPGPQVGECYVGKTFCTDGFSGSVPMRVDLGMEPIDLELEASDGVLELDKTNVYRRQQCL
jgi:hypothetical protein